MKVEYELEIERIKEEIKKKNPKTIILQLPEGLKPYAVEIVNEIKTDDIEVFIWMGTCYGACDIPGVKADLLIQFGHNAFVSK